MLKDSVIFLIAEQPEAHGVYDTVSETKRKVYCYERSMTLKLTSEANAAGLFPTLRVLIPNSFDYHGEKLAEYNGVRYKVVNSYAYEKTDGFDLLLERVEGNAVV